MVEGQFLSKQSDEFLLEGFESEERETLPSTLEDTSYTDGPALASSSEEPSENFV